MKRPLIARLFLFLLALAPFSPVFAHSGEWTGQGPMLPYPPDPLPKWPGPITMKPKTDLNAEPSAMPGKRTPRGGGRSGWDRWWYVHRERLLDLRGIPGRRRSAEARKDVPDRDPILAALRKFVDHPNEDIRTSAIVALGRAGDAQILPRLASLIRADDSSAAVVESALLAIGLVGTKEKAHLELIRSVLAAADRSPEVRSYAALALGMVGDADSMAALVARLGAEEKAHGVRAAAATGLGLLDLDAAAPALARALVGPDGLETNPGTRSYSAAALGALATGAGRTALMQALADLDLGVARQAAYSLGVHADPWARKALLTTLKSPGDARTRAYAGLSLAEAGETAAADLLQRGLAGDDEVLVPHAAVALGLLARRAKLASAKTQVILTVQSRLADLTGPDLSGALVIAGALAGADGLSKRYADLFRSETDPGLRGHTAFAIGLLGGDPTALVAAITAETPPPLLREIAIGTALLASAEAEKKFRELLTAGAPQSARCVAAVSLGLFRGDGTATTAALLAVLSDEKQPDLVRGCAAVGLGRRLEKDAPSRLTLPALRLSPGLVAGPFKEVMSMR
jgi:HEAT repeat protein